MAETIGEEAAEQNLDVPVASSVSPVHSPHHGPLLLSRHRPVINGLQLRRPKQEQPFRGFTYSPVPQRSQPISVEWRLLESGDVESEHIRVHDLQDEELENDGEILITTLQEYRTAYAKAVVIISLTESLALPEGVSKRIEGLTGYPVVMISRNEGDRLLECLNVQYEDEELLAQLVVESNVELGEDDDTVILGQSTDSSRPESHKERGFFSQLLNRRPTFDVRGEVKKLMFDGDVFRNITEDSGRFTMIMATFSQYEKTATAGTHSGINHLLERFLRYFNEVFMYEYPFFLILINRMYKNRALYECDELPGFIRECIGRVETMAPERIEETLIGFIRKKDFDVMDGAEEATTSVFMLLANACLSLMSLSSQVKKNKSGVRAAVPHFVYHRMLWISIHLKCVDVKGLITRSTIKIWEEHFIRLKNTIPINRDTISDFKAGMVVSKRLKLNPEIQFTPQLMVDFLVGKACVRSLAQIRDFVQAMETYITSERDMVVTFLSNLRSWYSEFLFEKQHNVKVSEDGTLLGVVDEAISFLDTVTEIWNKKGWRKSSQNKDFRNSVLDWLLFLIVLVPIKESSAVTLLKKFLGPRRGVVADQEYRKLITQKVLRTTKLNFHELDIHQFFALYKAFRIWPNDFLFDFLKQYKVPKNIKISDPSWTEFFTTILDRFRSHLLQLQLLGFLQTVGDCYRDDDRTPQFIPDLLQLNVPRLFAIDDQLDGSGSSVGDQFVDFLKSYVKRHNLQKSLLSLIQSVLPKLTDQEQHNFQRLIFTVLQSEIIPEFRALQGSEKDVNQQLKNVLIASVTTLCQNMSWFSSLSPRQEFCWGVVAACTSKIPVTAESFDWIFAYDFVIATLGQLFNAYVNTRRLRGQECILSSKFPDEVADSTDNVVLYFQWVRKSQDVLSVWQGKFLNNEVNFDDVLVYANHHTSIDRLGRAICADSTFMDGQDIQAVKNLFITHFDQLNTYLLKYIPGHPEARWITLPALLAHYGVSLPLHLQEVISKHVLFPGEDKPLVGQLLHNKFPIGNGMFQPGHEISLNLTRAITLKKLLDLLQDIISLLQDMMEHLDLLVFFHLQQSEIFKKHLMKYLEDATAVVTTTEKVRGTLFSSFRPVVSYQQRSVKPQQDSTVNLDMLEKALESVNSLLKRLLEGTATYADIVAGGALKLESLNIDREFEIFTEYARHAGLSHIDGLAGVQCMLELFQFTHHIKTIHSVCDQYQLKQCLADPTLHKLMELKKELSSEDTRAKLTPVDAVKKMSFIKTSLCLEGAANFNCLQIFPVVANSAVFYQFIQEKQFAGEKGQALFQQQYQLITAQLQHEEYDDNVLNQLRAGFVFMSPFMDREQSFKDLMIKITRLDTSHGLKQLETVNENITLVRLWFSRAEGETIENVANELDHILDTGIFNFTFSSDESSTADIILVYQPSQPVTAQPDTDSIGSLGDRERSPLDRGSTLIVDQHWNSEHIADFVRKLGFLDTEREGGDRIKFFIHLNSTANKLLELYCKLRELGHPSYQQRVPECLRCSITQQEADQKVLDTEKLVFRWSDKVSQLRREYSWLLFFSVPKLLLLHSLVDEMQPDLAAIVAEISFLFENDSDVREKLSSVVKDAIVAIRSSSGPGSDLTAIVSKINKSFGDWDAKESVTKHVKEAVASTWTPPIHTDLESHTPMHILGQLLNIICSHRLLAPHLLKQRSSRRGSLSKPTLGPQLSLTSQSSSGVIFNRYQLHYGPNYDPSQIIRMIIEIFQGVPEGFAVFHCRSTTSAEELALFIERMKHYHLPYLVLQVNQLPFKLQELLMNIPLGVRDGSPTPGREEDITTVHFLETSPSVLREMPWITLKENPESGPEMSIADAGQICRRHMLKPCDFNCIQLVYGHAGDGKTHYITQQLAQSRGPLTIAVNEAFTPLSAIKKLKKLPLTKDCAIFFNFTILPYQEDDTQQDTDSQYQYYQLMDSINWFFFDFLILGYVEDPVTGHGFRFPGGLEWSVYVEVPSYGLSTSPEDSLAMFRQAIPTLALVGSTHQVYPQMPYTVNDEVRLVCKYLSAYKNTQAGNPMEKGIDRLYREAPVGLVPRSNVRLNQRVKFSLDEAPSDEECHSLLTNYMPDFIQKTKITQRLFIKYMKRRCSFLDELPAFNFNTGVGEVIEGEDGKTTQTDTRHLGSTLMTAMLEEVESFCDPAIKKNWTEKPHQQLIYDFRDGGGSFGLLSLRPENLSNEVRANFKKIGFKLPSRSDLQKRDVLDRYLARALGLQSKRLTPIDVENYVLTPDYTMKMLNIHERYECGVPVIINGETGVGKTALVNMLSKLWSHSVIHLWEREKESIEDAIRRMLGDLNADSLDNYQSCIQTMQNIALGKEVTEEELVILGKLPDASSSSGHFHSRLREHLFKMLDDPARVLLYLPQGQKKQQESREEEEIDEEEGRERLNELFRQAKDDDSAESTAALMNGILQAKLCNTFHKLNVHAALTPADIKDFFVPVFKQAKVLMEAYDETDEEKRKKIKMPFVTAFLDEVNTSSCPGLFKEIIVDRTLDGNSIPANLFIVAACNPHRGNSMASHAEETWVRGSYYVRPLHPTLEFLMWDYGALDSEQEKDYIRAKMQMLNKQLPNIEVVVLTDLIMESQSLMRNYARNQLTSQKVPLKEAEVCAQSCVSQRDIQRVFTFYQWLMTVYERHQQFGERTDYPRRAVMVALGIVYYLRLNDEFRMKYRQVLDRKSKLPGEVNFNQAFSQELDWFTNKMELPPGIAKTQALMENLFAVVVCTVTHTPLILVGAPGSSKTLSFNLAIANLKGPESKMDLFRDVKLFRSLDPHFYQCSRRTTSNEIKTVFQRAINRQRTHAQYSLPIYCVVFMDEAGLPEESHESLKVLHYHLDKQEVSFVAISNHVLDAAKTNRAVSLFRPAVSDTDLKTLARGCLCSTTGPPPPDIRKDLDTIVQFCPAYQKLMDDGSKKFARFFGLRDFIHFVNYLRRRRTQMLTPQLVMEALERNFNGIYWGKEGEHFKRLCDLFLCKMETAKGKPVSITDVQQRSILTVLKESLQDCSEREGGENEVRYKLIIDPSEDSSVVRLLFRFGVLQRDNTRIYVCSNFPGDNQLQKINTIAAIRHSAIEGHTVVMSQTDDIHESFYDLFNQRFRRIDDPDHGPRYYTNIAIGAHLKPCRVHGNFQCVVVVRQSEVDLTPAPFLNRFEKYCISHAVLLATAMSQLPPCLRVLVENTKKSVAEFIALVGAESSLYGLQSETLDSLLLYMLPASSHQFQEVPADQPIGDNVRLYLLQQLLTALRTSAGFCVPMCDVDELQLDADYILDQLLQHPAYDGAYQSMTTDSAYQAVAEAIRVLHTAPAASDEEEERGLSTDTELSTEGALVVSLLQQWLIRHLCKNLMQLMTTEALTLHRRRIPASYIDHYLTYQQHFSLKELISHHDLAAQSCNGNLNRCATKLLCFTRSSPLIHQLPSSFSCFTSLSDDRGSAQLLQQLVFEDTSKLVLHKLAAVQSQSSIQELLRMFVHSPKQQVMVILVNMKETKKDIVNHLRIMIEEEEVKAPKDSCKLFVMLLHFPPAMFFDACYQSLFLRGWSHCYLDTIGHNPKLGSGIVDIQEWFQRCCFKKSFPEDSLLTACRSLLDDIIPTLASQVQYGVRSKRPFTQYMRASERCRKLRELLFKKGVGEKLCQMFRSCWKPPVLAEYLERAAAFTHSRESSLNLTDAIQTMFRSAFTDFLIYMLSRMNQSSNLDVLFIDSDEENSKPVEELFLALLGCLPIPKLHQLKVFAGSLPTPKPQDNTPQFPFFELVYKDLKGEVEKTRKIVSEDVKLLEDEEEGEVVNEENEYQSVLPDLMKQLTMSTVEKLREKLEDDDATDPILVCLRALRQNAELQGRYFTDFTYHVLKVDIFKSPLSGQIIDVVFADILPLEPVLKLVYLHVYATFNKLDLANITVLLRPLETIFHVAEITPHAFSPPGTSEAKQLVDAIQATKHPFGDPQRLSQFIISALFSALVGSVFPQNKKTKSESVGCSLQERLKVWHNTYLSVTSNLALKAHLHSQELPDQEQAKFNVMHTTFIMNYIHCSTSNESLFKASQVFNSLFSRHFLSNLQLREGQALPQLKDSVAVCSEVLQEGGSATLNKKIVCRLLEGLFSHYFSSFRQSFSCLDQLWFLQLANTHREWRAVTQQITESVVSSSYSEDIVTKLDQSIRFSRPPGGIDIPPNVVSLATFKMFLSRVLGQCDPAVEDSAIIGSGPLLMYNPESRLLVADVLLSEMDETSIGSYIPIFYQDCRPVRACPQAENLLMQQPLCHLYFITVMEHLFSDPRDIEGLVRVGQTISQLCLGTSTSSKERLILQIEKQAVIQAILKGAASQFAPNNLAPSTELNSVVEELNVLLADESTGGGAVGGHGLTMGMHLLHRLKSARKFTELLTSKFDVLVKDVQCLHPINQQLKNQTAENKPYLFPFMLAEHSNNHFLSKLYHQVKNVMLAVHSAQASQESVDALLKVAKECNAAPSQTTQRHEQISKVDKRTAFRMMVWLVTYYEFYCNKVSSGSLHKVVQQRLGHRYFGGEGVVRLIQSFLLPKQLISMPESQIPLREDAQVLRYLPDGRVEHIEHGGPKEDPLLDLFKPPRGKIRDQSDVDLCHSLANLIAVILGCQPQSNHLWYNLFAADQLTGTFMPGFMYNHKIDPDGLLYDCGIELTAEGQYGRPDYIPHATRGTYSLHSLYLILFANFGAFSMSLLTQPMARSKIQGPVISAWQPIRHYCFSQLQTVWMHIQNNLGISEEERSFLIMRCLMNFYETSMEADCGLVGKLNTRDELDEYESTWHNKIYLPAWNELKMKYSQYSVLWQSKVFVNIRMLESCFPHFPNENTFLHHIQSRPGREERLDTLQQFAMDKARLQIGGQLLPDLIEFYQWLHTQLAHQLTHLRAYNTLTIGRVVHLASNRMPHDPAAHLKDLYKRVKIGYAEYVDLVGGAIGMGACAALRRGNKIFSIDDNTPLVHFLSDSEVIGEGNDWLFLVIADIAQTQTLFVENLYAEIESSLGTHRLARLLPKDPAHVYPAEASVFTAIVRPDQNFRGVSEFLQLVRSRVIMEHTTNRSDPSSGSPARLMSLSSGATVGSQSSLAFSLEELQEDIVADFIAGKPIIRDIDAIRTIFKFREDVDVHHSRLSDPVGITYNLSLVDLPASFKVDLPQSVSKCLEYDFHSSSYHTLNELVRGLRTMLGHLVTALADEGVSDHERMTLLQFVISQYGRSTEDSSTFTVIGIRSISENQEKCLSKLNLIHLYSSLSLFISWVKEGRYDYCGLPLALKTHLSTEQITALDSIPVTFRKLKGTLNQLQQELKGMGEVLRHVETHLVSLVNESPQKPLMELLSDLNLISDTDHLPRLIPPTVCVQHYMSLRLALRRLTAQVKQQLEEEDSSISGYKQWGEFVEDLWTSQLAHLREEELTNIDPVLVFGFIEEDDEEESDAAGDCTELADDLNRDQPQGDDVSMIGDPMLYNQMSFSSYQDIGPDSSMYSTDAAIQSTLRMGLEDPSIRDEVVKLINQKKVKETAEQRAQQWSPNNVADFLRRIGLGNYANKFQDEEVDGSILLMANKDTFDELGVKSTLDRVRIIVLYRRELQGADDSEPVRVLRDLLKEKNLTQYMSKLEHAGVDADMIMYAIKTECHDTLLTEAGIKKGLHRSKIVGAAVKSNYASPLTSIFFSTVNK